MANTVRVATGQSSILAGCPVEK